MWGVGFIHCENRGNVLLCAELSRGNVFLYAELSRIDIITSVACGLDRMKSNPRRLG